MNLNPMCFTGIYPRSSAFICGSIFYLFFAFPWRLGGSRTRIQDLGFRIQRNVLSFLCHLAFVFLRVLCVLRGESFVFLVSLAALAPWRLIFSMAR